MAGSKEYQRFVLISRSRTGSYLLRSYLNSHPHALTHGEIFGRLRSRSYQSILKRAYGRYPRNVQAVGFKLFYYHPLDDKNCGLWETLKNDQGVRVIHLVRRDVLRTLVSRAVAGATDEWMRVSKAAPAGEQPRIHVDEEWFSSQIEKTFRWQAETREQFRAHPFLEVSYEDLISDLQRTFGGVTTHLGLDPIVPVAKQRRQGTDDLDRVIDNQDSLRRIAASFASKP